MSPRILTSVPSGCVPHESIKSGYQDHLGSIMLLCDSHCPVTCTFTRCKLIWKKSNPLNIINLLNSSRVEQGDSFKRLRNFWLFILWGSRGVSLLPQWQNFPNPERNVFWSFREVSPRFHSWKNGQLKRISKVGQLIGRTSVRERPICTHFLDRQRSELTEPKIGALSIYTTTWNSYIPSLATRLIHTTYLLAFGRFHYFFALTGQWSMKYP